MWRRPAVTSRVNRRRLIPQGRQTHAAGIASAIVAPAGKRLELDDKPGRERRLRRPHSRDPIDSVATQLAVVVYDKQDKVAVLGEA